jgi:hypothetical protein
MEKVDEIEIITSTGHEKRFAGVVFYFDGKRMG